MLHGCCTTSTSALYITIPFPCLIGDDVTGATVTSMVGTVRGIKGYLNSLSSQWNFIDTSSSGIMSSVAARIEKDCGITVVLTGKSAFTNIDNNTPISCMCTYTITLT